MSIQKITQSEILENGVKGLPTRPSTPSLYRGNTLSAEELKAAFDKLPTLIAERFNDLLESTGLYDAAHPADSLAALIATNLESSHSLLNFFEDVKNGNLSLYLTADENGKSLADVLSELRTALKKVERFTVSVEGDGDLLTSAEIQDNTLKIIRGAHVDEILNEAKTYTDTPSGEVDAGCTTPVSGSAVYHAIQEISEAQAKRIVNLENAATGILYTYPLVKDAFSYTRNADNLLANAALLQMGAVPLENYNFFPEKLLYDFTSGDLSIRWDDEEKVLVINGTLPATEEPLIIAPFNMPVPESGFFACGVFYRGGSISTEKAKISIRSNLSESIPIPLLMENSILNSEEFKKGTQFHSIAIEAKEDTVFDNYRINFIISYEQITLHYEPFCSLNRFAIPKKFVCYGPNTWDGEAELIDDTYVSFRPKCFSPTGSYIIGFVAKSSLEQTDVLVSIRAGETTVYEKLYIQNAFNCLILYTEEPLTEIRIYAAKSEESSIGHSIRVKNIYIYPSDPDYTEEHPYTPYHRDEIVFPDSLTRFADRFIGINKDNCNYFDFELGCFYDFFQSFQINGSLQFEEVDRSIGRFSASIAVPAELLSKNAVYQPSSIFNKVVVSPTNETLWLTADHIYFQSTIFVGKDANAVQRFFELSPIDIVYKRSTQKLYLQEDLGDFCEAQTFMVQPTSYLYFSDETGTPIKAFSKIQYQTKGTTA